MVIAVKNIHYFLCSFTFCHPMKNKTMGNVFKKRPEDHASRKCKRDPYSRIIKTTAAIIQHVNNDRQINTPDHQRVGLRQHLEVLIFEKPRLSFIMNFFKIHSSRSP